MANDIHQEVALLLEQNEDFPAVIAEHQHVRAYPTPYGINAAHLLGYLSPITEDEFDAAEEDDDQSLHGGSSVGRAGVEKQYDEWLRGFPGYRRSPSTRWAASSATTRWWRAARGHPRHLDRRPGAERRREAARREDQVHRATLDTVTGRNYVADSGAAVVLEANTGRVVAMASQPTYDPGVWVGGISNTELERLYSERPARRCSPARPRASSRPARPGSRS